MWYLTTYIIVDVGAVDTFRPKGQISRKLTNDQFVGTIPTSEEGSSGEIADKLNSILPVNMKSLQ